jgi:polysaccharide export outer membrane protein
VTYNEFNLLIMRAGRWAMLLALSAGLASPTAAAAQTAKPAQPAAAQPAQPAATQPAQPAATQPAQPAATPTTAGADQTYILGPADVIEVSIPGRTDFTTRGRIGENGAIELPYLGSVAAAGRNPVQLSKEIGQALEAGGYFSKPTVSVQVVSYASKYVTVLGEVASPGLVPVDRAYHLSEIIARVGGVKETGADYVILRPDKGQQQRIALDTLATGDESQDPYVSPGDKIYSPKADLLYISGQVNAPGAYALTPDMTLSMAIARAGGVNANGSLSKVAVTRHGVKTSQHDLNAKAQAGDIIVVGERLF